MSQIKIYTDTSGYHRNKRGFFHPLVKPFIGKGTNFDDISRMKMYGISNEEISLTENIKEADIGLLPMSWNYYYEQKLISKATDFIRFCETQSLKILTWNEGDAGVRVPDLENIIVHRQSGYRSLLPSWHQGMPVFIGDPLKRFYGQEELIIRDKYEKPTIGFCGQAKGSLTKYAIDIARTSFRNVKYYFRQSVEDPQTVYPSTLRRSSILSKIENDTRLNSNFIKREKYRAGAITPEEQKRTTIEFYDNIIHSDYIVCVRGGGNFSVRLYEALAMGRIPIFVDTDCLLPLSDQIKWKNHVVWVEEKDISRIGDIILKFHNNLSNHAFQKLQIANRKLWLEKMSIGGFFKSHLTKG